MSHHIHVIKALRSVLDKTTDTQSRQNLRDAISTATQAKVADFQSQARDDDDNFILQG